MPDTANTATFNEDLFFAYSTFYEIISRRAADKGLAIPEVCVPPEALKEYNANLPEDFAKIASTMQNLVDFTEQNQLRKKLSEEEIREKLDKYKDDYVSKEGRLLNKILETFRNIRIGIRIRSTFDKLIEFTEERNALMELINREKYVVEEAGLRIEKEGFPVDGRKLIKNYLSSYRINAKKAYETLTTNPAFFSPIIFKKKRKGLFGLFSKSSGNPEDGIKINRDLAAFLKKMKL